MKKNEKVEKKIYEYLGVNLFRKYVLFNWEKVLKKFNFDCSYHIDKLDYDSIKNYKEIMKSYAIAHLITMIVASFFLIDVIPVLVLNIILNGYCIMTQRYNTIRANDILKKNEVRYNNTKKSLEDELREKDNEIDEHVYKTQYKNEEEKTLDIDELISNASIEQLKNYKEFLTEFEKEQQVWNRTTYTKRISTNKVLSIELKER